MPRKTLLAKQCVRCEGHFVTRSPEQMHCSRSCAAKGPRPNRRKPEVVHRICSCGTTFVPSLPRVRFCSPACGRLYGGAVQQKKCPQCLAEFDTKTRTQLYCSLRCQRGARRARSARTCQHCGAVYHGLDSRQQFCSRRCALLGKRWNRGEQSPNWKGGRTRTSVTNGYVRVRSPDHPRAKRSNPYVLEHILIMEKTLGRFLLPNERVHHRNGRRDDNRPENLELWKMKDPPGVRSSDYHCAGCNCDRRSAPIALSTVSSDRLAEADTQSLWNPMHSRLTEALVQYRPTHTATR